MLIKSPRTSCVPMNFGGAGKCINRCAIRPPNRVFTALRSLKLITHYCIPHNVSFIILGFSIMLDNSGFFKVHIVAAETLISKFSRD